MLVSQLVFRKQSTKTDHIRAAFLLWGTAGGSDTRGQVTFLQAVYVYGDRGSVKIVIGHASSSRDCVVSTTSSRQRSLRMRAVFIEHVCEISERIGVCEIWCCRGFSEKSTMTLWKKKKEKSWTETATQSLIPNFRARDKCLAQWCFLLFVPPSSSCSPAPLSLCRPLLSFLLTRLLLVLRLLWQL